MKAPRLRAGLVLLVIGAFVLGAFVAPTAALAGEAELKAALDDYAAGRYEDALTKLREYVAANPGEEEVYMVLRDADEKVLLRVLAKQGEHERLMKYLLAKAKPVVRAQSLDADEIQELVRIAVNDDSLDKRRAAGLKLIAAGDAAVPYLFPFLGRSDAEVVVNAMFALHRLGKSATYPLIAVLKSDNARVAGNAAAVLGDLKDPHGVPALIALAKTAGDEYARDHAERALRDIDPAAIAKDGANEFVALGEKFLSNDPTIVVGYDDVRNLWRWENGDLARYEVPAFLFPYQMAEQLAIDALALSPGNKAAQSLLVRALLAQKAEADALRENGGDAPEVLAGAFDVASGLGFDAATEALRKSLKNGNWDVAVEAIKVVAATHGDQDLSNHPLGAALVAPERRVREAAAVAALLMSPRGRLPNMDKVANLAARAASEKAVRQVLVIDDRDDTRSRLVMDLAHADFVAAEEANGADGVARAKSSPTLDVVLVRADLGDPRYTIPSKRLVSSMMVIDELKSDVRTKDMRIVVLVADTNEAKADAVKEFFVEKYGDQVAGFVTVPIDTAIAVETVDTAANAGDLNPDRARANRFAAEAAEAFAKAEFAGRAFDPAVAVAPLATAALEGATPEIRLWATKALGNIKAGGGDALMKVLQEADDDALKAAGAEALGLVMSVQGGTPEQIEALLEAAKGEGDVAVAALKALGRAKGLTAEQRRALFDALRLKVAEKAGI